MNEIVVEGFNWWSLLYYGAPGLVGLILLFMSFFTVEQQTEAIIERFGKFHRTAKPGLRFKIPGVDQIVDWKELRVIEVQIKVDSITKDKVSVDVVVAVQYYVLPDKVYEAYYKLDKPERQMASYVSDVVRSKLPALNLDDAFHQKDSIALAVKEDLSETMCAFGYGIQNTLVIGIKPDGKVQDAMNEINAAQRLRVAATEKGEAEKILQIKQAEAESQSKVLQGQGVAGQRKAIIDGLRESIQDFKDSLEGTTAQDVMTLVLMTQYFDAIKEIGGNANSNTIFVQNTPGGLTSLRNEMLQAMAHRVN